MAIAAFVVSLLALLASLFVALGMIEVVSSIPRPGDIESDDDELMWFNLSEDVMGAPATRFGIPNVSDIGGSVLLVVSPMCKGCGRLLDSFRGQLPERASFLITAGRPEVLRSWAAAKSLPGELTIFDDDQTIVAAIGVEGSPTVIGFANGQIAFAVGVAGPSAFAKIYERALSFSGEVRTTQTEKQSQ